MQHKDTVFKVVEKDSTVVYGEYSEGDLKITKVPYYKTKNSNKEDVLVLPLPIIMRLNRQVIYMFSNDIEEMDYNIQL